MQAEHAQSAQPHMTLTEQFWQRLVRHRPDDTLPHTITHQRIYIVPTRRGLAFLLALLLMLIASVNYALSLGYALCFVLTGLFSATLLHTYRNLAGLTVQRIEASDVFAGESATVNIHLADTANRERQGIRVGKPRGSRAGYSAMTHVPAGHHEFSTLNVPTDTRGVLSIGRLTIQSDWPLGLWTAWSYLHTPAAIVVFPVPESEAPPLPTHHESSLDAQPHNDTQGDVSGLRDYIPGDSIGSIAWKSAARGLGLQVRMFESSTAPGKAVLSLHTTGMYQLEDQLSRLCAWVLRAEASRVDYALELPDESLTSSHGQIHRRRALRMLAMHASTP